MAQRVNVEREQVPFMPMTKCEDGSTATEGKDNRSKQNVASKRRRIVPTICSCTCVGVSVNETLPFSDRIVQVEETV